MNKGKLILLVLVLSIFSCKNASEKTENNPNETTEVEVVSDSEVEQEDISEEITAPKTNLDKSLTFPFGMDISTFTKEGIRTNGAGDCFGTITKYTKEKFEIGIDDSSCDIYGFNNKYFLLSNDVLKRVHQKQAQSQAGYQTETASYVLTEKVFNFSVKPYMQYVRQDTVKEMNIKLLQTDFVASEIEDSETLQAQLMAQYIETWKDSSENEDQLILKEDRFGGVQLEKGRDIDVYLLREKFTDYEVSKTVGEQDGPDYFYYTIGEDIIISTADTTTETLDRVQIYGDSNIEDVYGIKGGMTFETLKLKRPNLKISTEHNHIYLYEEGSHIVYEMSLTNYNGPDKDTYTLEELKNAKVSNIIWR